MKGGTPMSERKIVSLEESDSKVERAKEKEGQSQVNILISIFFSINPLCCLFPISSKSC